jgi:hypothetical protein
MSNFLKISSILVGIILSLSLTGCEDGDKESAEAKTYEVSDYISQGEYQKALDLMDENCSGLDFTYDECQLNLGACYLGLNGYTITSLGQDVVENSGDTVKLMQALFKTFMGENVIIATEKFNKVLGDQISNCSEAGFELLNKNQQQACLAINPLVLLSALDDSDDGEKSSSSISIQNLVKLNNAGSKLFKGLPEGSDFSTEFATVMAGGESPIMETETDKHQCALNAFKSGTFNASACASFIPTQLGDLDLSKFGITNFPDLGTIKAKILKMSEKATTGANQVLKSTTDINSYRIVLPLDENNLSKMTVILASDEFVNLSGEACDPAMTDNCFPKPSIEMEGENANLETLGNTILYDLNNDKEFLYSIALMAKTSSEHDNKTDKQKVVEFQHDMCNKVKDQASFTQCTYDETSGDVTEISEDAFLQFIAGS